MGSTNSITNQALDAALLKETEVHLDDIWGDCAQQAGRYAYWLAKLSEAELSLQSLTASLDAVLRGDKETKKLTETAIERGIHLAPQWVDEKRVVDKLRAIVEGLRQRYGMLQAISSIERRQPFTEMDVVVKRRNQDLKSLMEQPRNEKGE